MRTIDENIWVFDGSPVPFFGLPYTTRMTVVRLPAGELWYTARYELINH